jgi:hypothetical protein
MKLSSVFLIAVLQATTLQNGCASRPNRLDSQTPQVNAMDRSRDKELLKKVEEFAGEGHESSSAWRDLMSYDRQKLITDLSRISDGLPAEDRKRVLIAFTFCKMRYDYEHNRPVVLSALSKRSPYKDLYGDWVVTMIGSLVRDGDKDLLDPLFKASEWSDGAMTTDLASEYGKALLMDPESFLKLLSVQTHSTRDGVIDLLPDNSLTPEQTEKIKRYLKGVAPSSKLAPIAGQILKALSK